MTQKKNPYLLEKIKGKAISISGVFSAALATIHKTSFSNSVEVGTEALINFYPAMLELSRAIELLTLVVDQAKPISEQMKQQSHIGMSVATLIAEDLAIHQPNYSFRDAHKQVSQTINRALEEKKDPLAKLLALDHHISCEVEHWQWPLEYGGGPGQQSLQQLLKQAIVELNVDAELIRHAEMKWEHASQDLQQAVVDLLTE